VDPVWERVWVATVVWAIVYVLTRDWSARGSFGKRRFGLRTVTSTDAVGLGRSILRNATLIVPAIAIVDIVAAMFDGERRRLGDRLAGTHVVAEDD
jgi:uncharacterized RDD family membrane protein YckC